MKQTSVQKISNLKQQMVEIEGQENEAIREVCYNQLVTDALTQSFDQSISQLLCQSVSQRSECLHVV